MTILNRRSFAAGLAGAAALGFTPVAQAGPGPAVEMRFSLFDGETPPPTTPFRLKGGEQATLMDFPGRPLIATFWATWCGPCTREMPALDRLATDLPQIAFAPLALDKEESFRKIDKYYRRHQIRMLDQAIDSGQSLARQFGVPGTPTSVVIDGRGGIRASAVGNVDWSNREIRAFLLSLA